ncbi:MAG: GNAT family protein [Candidatus Electrothrix communis]|nr:MAG: GNAT family protein [Candidatus Electrothrix communis]
MTNDFAYTQNRVTKDGIAFQLRPACVSDADIIALNIREVCAEQIYLHTDTFVVTEKWRQMLLNSVNENKGQLLIVAQVEKRIVGHLRLFPPWYGPKGRHVGEVGMAIVKPWRERGIGIAMMDYALSWASLAQFQKVIASVISTNHRALTLFSNLGFIQEGRLVQQINVAGRYVDDVLLGRFINHYKK